MELVNVTAVIVTRGDVAMQPVLESLPPRWDRAIWDNGKRELSVLRLSAVSNREFRYSRRWPSKIRPISDLSVYGRYAALEFVPSSDLIYVQDDDVIVSDPQAIVDAWQAGHVICNMPQEFRPHYPDSALVGFGACFERDLPAQAFARYDAAQYTDMDIFFRECDTVFTMLTPRILVDVPKTDRPFASDPDRLWKQPEHNEARARMKELARQVRDAT